MDLNKDYGIGSIIFCGATEESKVVKLGDGKTRVLTTVFNDNLCGLAFVRDEEISPFEYVEFEDGTTTADFEGEKVHLIFDNVHSINAVIGRLEWIKTKLK